MLREQDIDKIIENIKDIFYEEVDVEMLEVPDSGLHGEINEGKFFIKVHDYLKHILNNNEEKKIISKADIDYRMIKRSINYRQSISFVRNQRYGWEIPTIDDFQNLPSLLKSKFHDDIFWSSTPYDDQSLWCFSFTKNKKIVMNKGFYCNLCLKKTI